MAVTQTYSPLSHCEYLRQCYLVFEWAVLLACLWSAELLPTSSSGYELGSSNSPFTTCRSPHTDLR